MANCGGCSSNRTVCSCVIETDGATTTVIGNGGFSTPFAFNKLGGPTPRPLADMARSSAHAAQAIPINTQTKVLFDLNLGTRLGISVDSGMVDLAQDRITFNVAGKFIVGGWLVFDDIVAADNNRRDVRLSQGVPAGANVWTANSANQGTNNQQWIDTQALVTVTVGAYMEMWVFSTIADNIEPGATAQMYAIWVDEA